MAELLTVHDPRGYPPKVVGKRLAERPESLDLQERDHWCCRKSMLAAQMQNRADQAVAAVSVIVTTARPVAVVGKKLEHQIEQLHRLADFGFRHWFDPFRSGVMRVAYHRQQRSASPLPQCR